MGSALDVLNEHIAELLYGRIETPTRPEQLRTRTALGTRLRTFCRTESGPKTPLLSTPSPRALETQRGRGCIGGRWSACWHDAVTLPVTMK